MERQDWSETERAAQRLQASNSRPSSSVGVGHERFLSPRTTRERRRLLDEPYDETATRLRRDCEGVVTLVTEFEVPQRST